jgi:NitT/TauT family transport system substrate-binding protein
LSRTYDRRDFLRLSGAVVAGMAGLSFLNGCATSPAPGSKPAEKVRLISWSQPRAEQANIFAAQHLGFFKEEGLECEYVPGQGSGDALKQLLAGNGDMAFVGPEALYFAAEQGSDALGVYNIYPQNLFVFISHKESGITQPADLKGKRVGVLSLASGTRYNLMTVLHMNGMKESDVTVVPIGFTAAPLMQKQVDVWVNTESVLWLTQQQGLGPVNVMRVKDHFNLPTDVLVVRREMAEKRPTVVSGMLRAIKRGTELMINQPDKAAELGVTHGLDLKDKAQAKKVIEIFAAASQSKGGLGWFDMEVLRKGAETYHATGLIKKAIDVDQLFTNRFVKEL